MGVLGHSASPTLSALPKHPDPGAVPAGRPAWPTVSTRPSSGAALTHVAGRCPLTYREDAKLPTGEVDGDHPCACQLWLTQQAALAACASVCPRLPLPCPAASVHFRTLTGPGRRVPEDSASCALTVLGSC